MQYVLCVSLRMAHKRARKCCKFCMKTIRETKYNISLSRFRRYTCTFIKIFLKQDLDDEQSVFPGPWLQVANTANLPRNHCNWHDLPAAAAASREETRGRCAALLLQKKCIFSVFWFFFFANRCNGKEEYWF